MTIRWPGVNDLAISIEVEVYSIVSIKIGFAMTWQCRGFLFATIEWFQFPISNRSASSSGDFHVTFNSVEFKLNELRNLTRVRLMSLLQCLNSRK